MGRVVSEESFSGKKLDLIKIVKNCGISDFGSQHYILISTWFSKPAIMLFASFFYACAIMRIICANKTTEIGCKVFNKGWYTYDIHENCPVFKTSTPLSIYVQNSSTPLTLDIQFQANPPLLPPSTNENQSVKRKYNSRMNIICYQGLPPGRFSLSVSTH